MLRVVFLFWAFLYINGGIFIAQAQNDISFSFDDLLSDARQANEALSRSQRFVNGWLQHCDSVTGLIPRNLWGDYYWNAQDAAADNYPFMVLTTFFTNHEMFEGEMKDMLNAEIKYTSRIGACPSTYDFNKQSFKDSIPDIGNIIFGSAEYMKDGLLPLTEWLGKSPWSDRMLSILDDLYELSEGVITKIEGSYLGGMQEVEANGDLLQVLSRMYWMTGKKQYLDWAVEIGDFYLLTEENSPMNFSKLRLRDHGGEIVLGLCELYATLHFVDPVKKNEYKPALYSIMNRILECGTNEHGMLYNEINPQDCSIVDSELADTWGYIYDGFYTIYMLDKHEPYRDAVVKAMSSLKTYYRNYDWEHGSHDGYADAIESAINLYNRIPISSVAEWIDSEIQVMLKKQKKDGIIEGWHGDGNYARTAVMYALWKSLGAYVTNWNEGILMAGQSFDGYYVFLIKSDLKDWSGRLCFDKPRHKMNLNLPIDWTRINQFPEWFAPEEDEMFEMTLNGISKEISGKTLHKGINISLKKGEQKVLLIKRVK